MKKQPIFPKSNFKVNNSVEGKHLYTTINRMMDNKEPITAALPVEYTDPKVGVLPQFDPRTDKWEIMQDGMDRATKAAKEAWEQRMAPPPAEPESGE